MGVTESLKDKPVVRISTMDYYMLSPEEKDKDVIYELWDEPYEETQPKITSKFDFRGSVTDMSILANMTYYTEIGTIMHVLEDDHLYMYVGGNEWIMMAFDPKQHTDEMIDTVVKCDYCDSEMFESSLTGNSCPHCGAPLKLTKRTNYGR